MNQIINTKFRCNGYRYPVTLEYIDHKRIRVSFAYNKDLVEEIKCMAGAKWHGYDIDSFGNQAGSKYWTVSDCFRNRFQMDYLEGKNPYAFYDQPIKEYVSKTERGEFEHQIAGTNFMLTRRQCILAYDCGIGKTLTTIEALEYLAQQAYISIQYAFNQVLWVGPRSALIEAQRDFRKWRTKILPRFVTYDSLISIAMDQEKINRIKVLVYDEASKIKNPTAKRSQAAAFLAENLREREKHNGCIWLLSGTPAPRSPADWWHLMEVACPGFCREGSYQRFMNRLGLIKQEENLLGGIYPRLVTWFDDENKCKICGKLRDSIEHDDDFIATMESGTSKTYHKFQKSKNEVAYLYERMKGLVLVKFKKDVLKELPEKIYRVIELEPSEELKRAEAIILKKSKRAVEALTLIRELSDGFQYTEKVTSRENCNLCKGTGLIPQPIYIGPEDLPEHRRLDQESYWKAEEQECPTCSGSGFQEKVERDIKEVVSPKENVIRDLMDEYDEVGRVVIYCGFTGSVDKIINLMKRIGWNWIRVDGRGWITDLPGTSKDQEMLEIFSNQKALFPKVAFVAQADSAGMGLNLTASPVIIYYSNTFNYESRAQSEERGHRPGMDLNKGLTIIDILLLNTDRKVRTNLLAKRNLQLMSMGELMAATEKEDLGIRYF